MNTKNLDLIAIAVSLGGLLLAVLVLVLGGSLRRDLGGAALVLLLGSQTAAIVLGLLSRRTPLGKAAAITASVLLVGTVLIA